MKQIILPFNTGTPQLIDVAAPIVQDGEILVQTSVSVVSTGTERMLLDFGRAGYLGKLKQQPERAKLVFDKIKTDGLLPTLKAVRQKLNKPIALGYSCAGTVIAVGKGVYDLRIGDRVACNGPHAEFVSVPRNLVAAIPTEVSDEAGAFTVLGAIALQSIRLVNPTFGETIVVIGLGLIGQLTVQLLIANGCRVIATDLDLDRMEIARKKGAMVLQELDGNNVRAATNGFGADAVIITASSNNEKLLYLASDICRKKGRIVLTGVAPIHIDRNLFFKKELSFQVSSSYGPGRYERAYEQNGLDYPIGYVRWTEGRNFQAVLQAIQQGQLDPLCLVTNRIVFDDALRAYETLSAPKHLASLFLYESRQHKDPTLIMHRRETAESNGNGIGVIGAGNFSGAVLLPGLKAAGASLVCIASKNGLSASIQAQKYGFASSTTDVSKLLNNDEIGSVVIATPHHTHASLTCSVLDSGRNVFVEKPLALERRELEAVKHTLETSPGSLTVGFNRRFAPLTVLAKDLLDGLSGATNICITVNAGLLPKDHWLLDKAVGGGRLLGEACHFVDLCGHLVAAPILAVCANGLNISDNDTTESASILLRFANGSNGVINYYSNGSTSYDKERVEIYKAGRTVIIENWKSIKSFGFKKDIRKALGQDKGHNKLLQAWVGSLQGKQQPPIAAEELFNTSMATIAMDESLACNAWVSV